MAYSFGKTSILRGSKVNEKLLMVAMMSLRFSAVDMSIPWRGGLRTASQQKELFNVGNSRCDGYIKKSYHQSGNALDVVPYYNGKIHYTDTKSFQQFAIIMFETFKYLQNIEQIDKGLYLHWGGFWSAKDENNDGYLHYIDDEFGWDQPHWEFRSKPQRNVLKFLTD